MKKWFVICLFATLFCTSVFAKDVVEICDTSRGIENITNILATITAEKYPEANSVLVYDKTNVFYNEDGTGHEENEYYLKIMTDAGRIENRLLSFYVNSSYTALEIKKVEIIKDTWQCVDIPTNGNLSISISQGQMSSNIYDPNIKEYNMNIPGLVKGDTIHVVTRKVTKKVRIPGNFSDYFLVEYTCPIVDLIYEISAPKSNPLRSIVVRDSVDYKFTEENVDDRILYKWSVSNIEQVFNEPSMPALHTCVGRVLVSTAQNWKEISKWYWELCEERINDVSEEMIAESKKLIEGCDTEIAKVRSIFKYVSQKIRYMGLTLEDEAPGYEPHSVDLTFKNKYGVCRDKAALLVAMLRIVGIDAFPVLIDAGEKMDMDVPLPYFNHAIVAVKLKGERDYILMDPTNESTKELLPEYLCEKSYLVATPEGEVLKESPSMDYNENLTFVDIMGSLKKTTSGNYIIDNGRVLVRFNGINDTIYRSFFAQVGKQGIEKFLRRIVSTSTSNGVLTGYNLTPEDLQNTTEPLELEIGFIEFNPLKAIDGVVNVCMPRFYGRFGYVNFIPPETSLDKRRFPLTLGIPCGVKSITMIDLPEGLTQENFLPSDILNVNKPTIKYKRTNGVSTNNFYISEYEYAILKSEIEAKDYSDFKDTIILLNDSSKVLSVWENKELESTINQEEIVEKLKDSEYVSTNEDNSISDKSINISYDEATDEFVRSSRNKFVVKNYAGVKSCSEFYLDYIEEMSSVKVINAKTISPSGEEREVTDYEMQIMDSGSVSTAPRYPKKKRLVVTLPKVEPGSTVVIDNEYRYPAKYGFSDIDCLILIGEFEKYSFSFGSFSNYVGKLYGRELNGTSGLTKFGLVSSNSKVSYTAEDLNNEYVFKEPNMAPLSKVFRSVEYSTMLTSEFLYALKDAVDASMKKCEYVRKEFNPEQYKDLSTYEKVKLVREICYERIKNIGNYFNPSSPLQFITTPDETWRAGYAHSFDKAILQMSLLSMLGVDSSLLVQNDRLVGVSPDEVDSIMNTPAVFHDYNSCVVKVKDASGKIYYLDDGTKFAEQESLADDVYLYFDYGVGKFVKPEVDKNYQNKTECFTVSTINDDGSATLNYKKVYYGSEAESIRAFYHSNLKEKRQRHFMKIMEGYAPGTTAISNILYAVEKYPCEVTYTINIPNFVKKNDDYSSMISNISESLYSEMSARYKYPTLRDYSLDTSTQMIIHLPSDTKQLLFVPESKSFVDEKLNLDYSRDVSIDGNVITIDIHKKLSPCLISPEDRLKKVTEFIDITSKHSSIIMYR